jgi:hypothetical protein
MIDPDAEEGHYQRALALRELGRPGEAEAAEEAYLERRVAVEENLTLRGRFRARNPGRAEEAVGVHTHALQPVDGGGRAELKLPAVGARARP